MFSENKIVDTITHNNKINFAKVINLTKDKRIYPNINNFLQKNWVSRQDMKLYKKITDNNILINIYSVKWDFYIESKKNNIDSWIFISNDNFKHISEKNILKKIISIIIVWIASLTIFQNYDFLKEYSNELDYRITSYYKDLQNPKLTQLNEVSINDIEWYLFSNDSFLSELHDSMNNYNFLIKKFGLWPTSFRDYLDKHSNDENYYKIDELEKIKILQIIPSKIIHDRHKNHYKNILKDLWLDENNKYSYRDLDKYFKSLMKHQIWQYNEIDKRYYDIIHSLSILPKDFIDIYILQWSIISENHNLFQDFNNEIWFNQFNNWITLNTDSSSKWILWSNRFMTHSEAFSLFLEKNKNNYNQIVSHSDNSNIYNYYNSYINDIALKLTKIWFNVRNSTEHTNIFDLGFYKDVTVENMSSIEYLRILEKIKLLDKDLFMKYKNIAWLNNKLLLNSINLLSNDKWFNQEWVQLYMSVFDLSKKDFYDSINAWYNIKIDTYLEWIFKWINIHTKSLKTYELIDDRIVTLSNILISDSKHEHKLIHELWHYLLKKKKAKFFSWKNYSISEYFKERNRNWDDNTVFYWDNWDKTFKYLYLEELNNSEGLVKRLWFTEYSLHQDKIGNTWNEMITELMRNFLTSPWYYAYLDLYWWDYSAHIRRSLPIVIDFLEDYWIFNKDDYEFFKNQARELKIKIDTSGNIKVKDIKK